MNTDSQSIVVNAPVAEVFRRCLHFEDLPRVVASMTKVDRIDDTHFSCTLDLDGSEVTAEVNITMRVPDRRIAWQVVSGQSWLGVVNFDPLQDGMTKVTVKCQSMSKPVLLTAALRKYLGNFKHVIEKRTRL